MKPMMNLRPSLWAALAAALVTLTMVGYAIASSLGTVIVESTPSGAEVYVKGQNVGTTPAKVQLPADTKVKIVLKKSGYKNRKFTIKPSESKVKRAKVTLKKE